MESRTPPKAIAWINEYWRPVAAIVYLVICICDFIIFPWLFGLREATPGQMALAVRGLDPTVAAVIAAPRPQWQPLTLMGSGLFHVAFGAIVGITAWTRGAEKIEGIRSQALNGYNSDIVVPTPAPAPAKNPVKKPVKKPTPPSDDDSDDSDDKTVDNPDQ